MKQLIHFFTNDGSDFFVEVDEPTVNEPIRGSSAQSYDRSVFESAKENFDKALKPLKEITNSVINSIKEISNSPDEIGVELGLKFTAKAGIILTSLDSEANFKIILKWQKKL